MKININEIEKDFLNIKEFDSYMEMVNAVKNSMIHPEWLGWFTEEEYFRLFDLGAKIVIFKYRKEMIASGMIIKSTKESLEKLRSSNLPYEQVIDYGPQMVNPNYIGNGLQTLMIETLDSISKKLGFKFALATIHPDNIYSINNFVKNNFINTTKVYLKRGPRNVYIKSLTKTNILNLIN